MSSSHCTHNSCRTNYMDLSLKWTRRPCSVEWMDWIYSIWVIIVIITVDLPFNTMRGGAIGLSHWACFPYCVCVCVCARAFIVTLRRRSRSTSYEILFLSSFTWTELNPMILLLLCVVSCCAYFHLLSSIRRQHAHDVCFILYVYWCLIGVNRIGNTIKSHQRSDTALTLSVTHTQHSATLNRFARDAFYSRLAGQ